LTGLKTHPTADELYPGLKESLPTLSLGSLYRNLESLSKEGMIAKMEGCGPSKRFDACVKEHFHFQCLNCGAVSDYDSADAREFRDLADKLVASDPSIRSLKIEFRGVCHECEKRINKSSENKLKDKENK